jgi:hypothetical protein
MFPPSPPPTRVPFTWSRFFCQATGLAVIMLCSLAGYLTVLKSRGHDAQFVTYTAWDDLFPYQPQWVWIYLFPYLVGPVVIGFLQPATFRWFVGRGLVVVGLTLLFFLLVPTQTAPRPQHHLGDGLTGRLYQWMIEIDEPPANAAPSLHVSLTCLLAFALIRDFRSFWPITVAAVLLVWVATLLTRQHHLVDVVSGAMLTSAVVWGWPSQPDRTGDKMTG